jgi:hypothetical protein
MPVGRRLFLILLLSVLPAARALAADSEAVSTANLLSSDRYWPYRVRLRESWQPAPGETPLRPGARGVLIRVEASGLARIDFGRAGLHDVPVAKTDLLESANRIRRGEQPKSSPNLVNAIGPRLLDPTSESLQLLDLEQAARQRGFLCGFADPDAEGFAALAQALAPLRGREGVLTILFPRAERSDARLAERLRALAWPAPFVIDHLAEAYARTLLPAGLPLPAVLLLTNEGRLVFAGRWTEGVLPELGSALDAAFPAGAAVSEAGSP